MTEKTIVHLLQDTGKGVSKERSMKGPFGISKSNYGSEEGNSDDLEKVSLVKGTEVGWHR